MFGNKKLWGQKTKRHQSDFEIDGLMLVRYCGNAETVVVPDEVRFVLEGAFTCCDSVKSVIFKKALYTIKSHAFFNCRNLKSITLPQSVDEIEESAFEGCSSLESIVIPEGLCVLRENTFSNCRSFVRITLPDTICVIHSFADNVRNVTICAHKGTFAEKYAREHGCYFKPLDGVPETGFYPRCSVARSPVVFYNPQKGVCKLIVNEQGTLIDFPGYEHPELILEHYDGARLPSNRGGRIDFGKTDYGYKAVMTIQLDSWYDIGESGYEHIDLYATMNDKGEFTSKFRLYKVGAKRYEGTDLEEKEYQEFLNKKK